ncbi:MAG: hypothetical protein RL261_1904 [Pseudomonadota bacterium]
MREASNDSDTAFVPWHRWDRNFFLWFVFAAWIATGFGFYPSVSERFTGQPDYVAPLVLQLHVFAFTGWLCLLSLQVLLVRTGRQWVHQRLGLLAAILIPVMMVTAIGAEIASQRFYSAKYPENLRFFISPVSSVALFAVFGVMAILQRRQPAAHKRLILLATTVVLSAAYNRWWGEALYALFGDGYAGMVIHNYAGIDLILVLLVAYDWVTRRRIHAVYQWGVPLIFITQLIGTFIYHSEMWPGIVRRLVGL